MARQRLSIIDSYDQDSPYVTEFRRLLHGIVNHASKGELKTIMLTSAMLSEGKSTTCSLLALTASRRKGYKTLVIDADLRRSAINRYFSLPTGPGLTEILIDGYNPKDAVQKTSIDKLDIISSGRYSDSPSEVFDAEAIGCLADEMKFYYDLVLIDCAPLLPVSDPMLLATKVDGVLLVVKAGATQKEVVERAVEIINPEKSNLLGVVLNNMKHTLPYYYDYGYYHYEYKQKPARTKKGSPGKGIRTRDKNRPVSRDQQIEGDIAHKK